MCTPDTGTFLWLLRRLPGGDYLKVDGNGNDACPNIFEVRGDTAIIGGDSVSLDRLAGRLARSKPIPFP
jgi:hypothetical protein